ncbi:hypothetical protein LY01_02654 [Nonlabens xylanidelens]|uniref:PH (Pleckstrin Homology) domain-containing protein n=1 Tax=Nonlabens xylanidelens TaxID=191564 RepID=A0A2S6IGQ3_9FLAO|nr:hypothetical protein [Nonlabens xylanidelens]PPK93366.1 hypothetical protein LY01_02654 [Nonlabens xylanidelens]PQJ22686.1 hypothetical protein BST94_03735 [Nonlabens xylanidelens]
MENLAPYNKIHKTILPAVLTFIVCLILITLLQDYLLVVGPVVLITIIIGYFIALRSFNQNSNAFYDTSFLYLIDKRGTHKINLANISSITTTPSGIKIMGFLLYSYTIYYNGDRNNLNSYSFMVSTANSNIEAFEKHMAHCYPNTRIDSF